MATKNYHVGDHKTIKKLLPANEPAPQEPKVNKFDDARKDKKSWNDFFTGKCPDKPQRELNTDNCMTGCKTNRTPEIRKANPLQTIGKNIEINPITQKEVKHNG